MRDERIDIFGAFLLQFSGGLAQRARRICHVIDNDARLAANVTNQSHFGNFVRFETLFVDERQLSIQAALIELRLETLGSLSSASIRRDNADLLASGQLLLKEINSDEGSLVIFKAYLGGCATSDGWRMNVKRYNLVDPEELEHLRDVR